MESIRTTVKRLVKDWQGQRILQDKEGILKGVLKGTLTKQEQKHIKYHSFQDSRLTLNADSSAWLYTLNLKRGQLLNNLNQALGKRGGSVEILLRLDKNTKYEKKKRIKQ